MINRDNWKSVRAYIKFRHDYHSLSDGSLRVEEDMLRRVLEWADARPFSDAPKILPTLPEYLRRAVQDDNGKPLSSSYVKKIISTGRRFLDWLPKNRPGHKSITLGWIDTLRPPKMTEEPKEHEFVTLDEILAMARAPVFTMSDMRIRAAVALMYLSAMRIGAVLTLPICAVDLVNCKIKQWPSLGVHTKNGKRRTTSLFPIPELLAVVREWDAKVRAVLPERGLWFAPLLDTGEIDTTPTKSNWRYSGAWKDLSNWLKRVGLPHHSPHKFRHGHGVWGAMNSDDLPTYKAVSQNMMHESITTTDKIYARFTEDIVHEKISTLGQRKVSSDDKEMRRKVLLGLLADLDKPET